MTAVASEEQHGVLAGVKKVLAVPHLAKEEQTKRAEQAEQEVLKPTGSVFAVLLEEQPGQPVADMAERSVLGSWAQIQVLCRFCYL